jgi:hypothetical protein
MALPDESTQRLAGSSDGVFAVAALCDAVAVYRALPGRRLE